MEIGHFTEFKSWRFVCNSPSSEQLEELWFACVFIGRKWSYAIVGIWWWENKNKLVVDTGGFKSAYLRDNFCSGVFCDPSNYLDVGKGHKVPYAAQND